MFSLLGKLKLLVPSKPFHAAIFFELLIVLCLGGSSYAVLSVTDRIYSKPKVEKLSVASVEKQVLTPTPLPTNSSTILPAKIVSAPTLIPTTSATPTPTVDPTSTWLTFTNSQYSYSVKYNPSWLTTDRGVLEPKIPTYIVFNPPNASSSARAVAIYITTRTYQEQLALSSANGIAITVAGISGTEQELKDSNNIETTRVILPSSTWLYVLEGKKSYISVFNQMLQTFKVLK